MKKALSIPMLLLFALIGVPAAHADSYTATFTCPSGPPGQPLFYCPFGTVPTSPNVTFPVPTLNVQFGYLDADNVSVNVTLPASDSPTDSYTWFFEEGNTPSGNTDGIKIVDETTNLTVTALNPPSFDQPYYDGNSGGSLTFSQVSAAAPEPAPIFLTLLGAGLIFLLRKRLPLRMPHTL
jgi:hypothetical protein